MDSEGLQVDVLESELARLRREGRRLKMLYTITTFNTPTGWSLSLPRRQRLVRSRYLGDQALWDAACSLVPSPVLQRRVLAAVNALEFPEWFPENLRRRPSVTLRFLPRLAAAFVPARRVNR